MARESTDIRFGDRNAGFQVGQSFAPFNAEIHLPPERIDTPPKPSLFIPFLRDRDFVKRGDLLEQIQQKLSLPGARVAIAGLGGVGKSQLAIEYSYRIRERSPDTWVLWIHGSSPVRFEQSVRTITELVKINGRKDPKADILQLFRAWLWDVRKGNWLIILDNADDASFLVNSPIADEGSAAHRLLEYLPVCEHGSILITTRSRSAALQLVEGSNIIFIGPMEEDDATELLRRKLDDMNTAEIRALAKALEFMPLAITQAAAYIKQRGRRSSVLQYLEEFRNSDQSTISLLIYDKGDLRRDRAATNSIILTWQISFTHILDKRPSAANLLSLMSLCDREAIPEFLIRIQDGGNSAKDTEFEDDIETLLGFAVISITDCSTFEMHRLVQLATQKWLQTRGDLNVQVDNFVSNLDLVFPSVNYENWSICQTLFPHAQSALSFVPQNRPRVLQWASVIQNAAEYASVRGGALLWTQALEMGERCWEARKRVLGEDHPDTLISMSNLAGYYDGLGESSKAAEIGERCWEARKTKLGEDHPDTLISMSKLAWYYNGLGESSKAAEIEERCWEATKTKLGEDHPHTLASMGNLAGYYDGLGESSKAAEIGERCWEARKTKLGEDHPHTLISMSKLAWYYNGLGESSKAAEIEERCWEATKTKLGEDHPHTLASMGNLAGYYDGLGESSKAAEIGERCWEAMKTKLGEDHPDTLITMRNLASYLRSQGRHDSAIRLLEDCINASIHKLGMEHPVTRDRVSVLRIWRSEQLAKLAKPRSLLRRLFRRPHV